MIQLLPIDETAPGENSPYSAMSVLAVDPLYISAHDLEGVSAGDLDAARVAAGLGDPPNRVKLHGARMNLLRKSFDHFSTKASAEDRAAREEFEHRNRQCTGHGHIANLAEAASGGGDTAFDRQL